MSQLDRTPCTLCENAGGVSKQQHSLETTSKNNVGTASFAVIERKKIPTSAPSKPKREDANKFEIPQDKTPKTQQVNTPFPRFFAQFNVFRVEYFASPWVHPFKRGRK